MPIEPSALTEVPRGHYRLLGDRSEEGDERPLLNATGTLGWPGAPLYFWLSENSLGDQIGLVRLVRCLELGLVVGRHRQEPNVSITPLLGNWDLVKVHDESRPRDKSVVECRCAAEP